MQPIGSKSFLLCEALLIAGACTSLEHPRTQGRHYTLCAFLMFFIKFLDHSESFERTFFAMAKASQMCAVSATAANDHLMWSDPRDHRQSCTCGMWTFLCWTCGMWTFSTTQPVTRVQCHVRPPFRDSHLIALQLSHLVPDDEDGTDDDGASQDA